LQATRLSGFLFWIYLVPFFPLPSIAGYFVGIFIIRTDSGLSSIQQ
jgi:hypothetical protein